MSQITTTRRRYTNIEDVNLILANRKRETYKLDGIDKISFNDVGKLIFDYMVRESDEFQFGIYSSDMVKSWYTPKHAFSQLAGYLGIPIRIYDFIEQAHHTLESGENEVFLSNLSENLNLLCQNRIKREEESKRLQSHYLTVFDDIFGSFVRRISSEIYRPYEDKNALIDTNNNLMKVNTQKGTNFVHKETYISPFQLTSNFVDESSKLELKHVKDEIKGGITLFNSETKDSSYGFQALIFRLACTNGMISEYKDSALTVKHMGDEFKLKTQKAFIKVLQLGNDFSKMFYELDKSKTISNDWNDLYELPNELFQMRNNEKKELISIAEKETYPFSPYGLVQALTFKSNHDAISDSKFSTLNQKALEITRKVDKFNKWKPKHLTPKEDTPIDVDFEEYSIFDD